MDNVHEHQKNSDWVEVLNHLSLSDILQEQGGAVKALLSQPFPSRKTEAWKYSNLNWLKKSQFTYDAKVDEAFIQNALQDLLTDELKQLPRVVTFNGQYIEKYSDLRNNTVHLTLSKSYENRLKCSQDDVITALNLLIENPLIQLDFDAHTKDCLILCINLGYAESSQKQVFFPKYSFHVHDEAQASVIEINYGKGIYFSNSVYEIELGKHANLNYTFINQSSRESYYCSSNYVKLSDHAHLQQFVLAKGSAFSRYEIEMTLEGEWSKSDFNAIQILSGHQHADITSKFIHNVPHCQSSQNVKNILSDYSHGVYQGKILVDRMAQKTDAQQQNQALLLSDHAEISTKPELEIYADDVKCSHGAAIGALDQEQLFFLMSRGIPYGLAREILISAFVNESIEKIENPLVQDLLNQYVTI